MVFSMDMAALHALAFIAILIIAKVVIRVGRILSGRDPEIFDIRKLPEFLVTDVLFEFGGLLALSLFCFIKPTDLPAGLAGMLVLLQGGFGAATLGLAGKYVAQIGDWLGIKLNIGKVPGEPDATDN